MPSGQSFDFRRWSRHRIEVVRYLRAEGVLALRFPHKCRKLFDVTAGERHMHIANAEQQSRWAIEKPTCRENSTVPIRFSKYPERVGSSQPKVLWKALVQALAREPRRAEVVEGGHLQRCRRVRSTTCTGRRPVTAASPRRHVGLSRMTKKAANR
jgi:hypothetical protein